MLNAQILLPLSPREWKMHEDQQRRMCELARRADAHDRNLHWLGSYLKVVRLRGLWLRDPRYRNMDLSTYASQVLAPLRGRNWSRTTVERHITIADSYSLGEYQKLRQPGTSFTVLAEVQRLSDPAKAALLLRAETRCIFIGDLKVAEKKAKDLMLAPPSQEALNHKIAAAIEKSHETAKQRRKQTRSGKNPGDPSGTAGMGEGERAALIEEQRLLERERSAFLAQQREDEKKREDLRQIEVQLDLDRGEADRRWSTLRESEQRVQEATEALRRREEEWDLRERLHAEAHGQGVEIDVLLKQEQERILAQREALKQEEKRIEHLRAEAQAAANAAAEKEQKAEYTRAEREKHEQCLAKADLDLAAREEDLAAARAEFESEKQACAEARAALVQGHNKLAEDRAARVAEQTAFAAEKTAFAAEQAAEKTAFAAERAALQAEREAVRVRDEQLAPMQVKLEDGLFQLDIGREQQAQGEAGLAHMHGHILADMTLLMKHARQHFCFGVPDSPWTLEATLITMTDHFDQIWRLCDLAQKQLQAAPDCKCEPADVLDAALDLAERVKRIPEKVREIGKEVLDEFMYHFKQRMLDRMEERLRLEEEMKHDPSIGEKLRPLIKPKGDVPVSRFGVPTGALLGNKHNDSPVQIVIGQDQDGHNVTLCLNGVQAMVLGGLQDSGKSSLIQGMIEAALGGDIENIAAGCDDIAVIVNNFNNEPGARPVPLSCWLQPNDEAESVETLRNEYRARPRGMKPKRIFVFTTARTDEELEGVEAEYPQATVKRAGFHFKTLGAAGIHMFMASAKNSALYMRRIDTLLARLSPFTLEQFLDEIHETKWTQQQYALVMARLEQMLLFVSDEEPEQWDLLPGDLVIVDSRSPQIGPSLAMIVFVNLMRSYSLAKVTGVDKDGKQTSRLFKKIVIFDEGHRYIGVDSGCEEEIEKSFADMRHRLSSIVLSTQDPESLPKKTVRLSTVAMLMRTKAVGTVRFMGQNYAGFDTDDPKAFTRELATLDQGESRVMSSECTNIMYRTIPQVLKARPTLSKPGVLAGGVKTRDSGEEREKRSVLIKSVDHFSSGVWRERDV